MSLVSYSSAVKKTPLKESLLKKALKLSIISMGANFLGFLIPIYIAYEYTISKDTDDFFLSYGIITFIGVMFSGAVKSVSIPYLKEKQKNLLEFETFISTVFHFIIKFMGILTISFFIIVTAFFFITDKIVYWYILLSVPIVFLTVINSFCYGILNSLDQFSLAEMSPFSRAIIIFLMIALLSDNIGIIAIILGYNIGELVKCLHLLYVIKIKNKLKINLSNIDYSEIRTFIKEGSYQVAATSLSSASPLIDKLIASFLIAGSITLLDYGDRLYMVFYVILNSFLVLILSKWSSDAVEGIFSISKLHKSMLIVFVLTLSLFVIIYFTQGLIVNLLFPKIDVNEKTIIGLILLVNMISFIFNAVSQVVNRATIAIRSTNILISISLIRLVLNLGVSILFAIAWGVIGIALATIVVNIVTLITNYFMFVKRLKNERMLTMVA